MIHGIDPRPAVAGLDTYVVTVIDHGMNALPFSARVVESTCSDLVSSIVATIGAPKGPLHGGAPGPVLDMSPRSVHPIARPPGSTPGSRASVELGHGAPHLPHRGGMAIA
jgi:citrate synthase